MSANRGERLGITVSNLNDKIADKIEEADLNQDRLTPRKKLRTWPDTFAISFLNRHCPVQVTTGVRQPEIDDPSM